VDAVAARRSEGAEDADAVRVAAGQQRGPGRRADGLGDVEVGEAHAVRREAVDVRGTDDLVAVAAEVGVAHVVGVHEDDVRRAVGGEEGGYQEEEGESCAAHGK
jgi:hypothetical protein